MNAHTMYTVLILVFFAFVLPAVAIWMDDRGWHDSFRH